MTDRRVKYLISAAFCFAIAGLCFFVRKTYDAESLKTLFGGLSDCFLVSGTVMTGTGLISWAGTFGTFDMLGYGTRLFVSHFSKSLAEKTPKTFYDYKVTKDEKGRKWLKETTVVGLFSLALSVLFIITYSII